MEIFSRKNKITPTASADIIIDLTLKGLLLSTAVKRTKGEPENHQVIISGEQAYLIIEMIESVERFNRHRHVALKDGENVVNKDYQWFIALEAVPSGLSYNIYDKIITMALHLTNTKTCVALNDHQCLQLTNVND